ncbi:MAG: TetR/AcrR family transcriptional regulator [Leptospiraceae bacterium]
MDPQKRRGQILGAARSLIFSSTAEGVRVEDILQELSLSKGGFYHHFASMEDVLATLVTEDLAGLLDTLTRKARESRSAVEALLCLFDFGSDEKEGESGILQAIESRPLKLRYLEILELVLYDPLDELLHSVLIRGMDSGDFALVPVQGLASIFRAVNRQLNRQAILQEEVGEIPMVRQMALRMLFRELQIIHQPEVEEFLASW